MQSKFSDVRLEQSNIESQFQCKQVNIHKDVTFEEGVSIASETWLLWTSDVDSAAAAVQSALALERQLKDFRFLSDERDAPLDSLPKILNSTMLRRYLLAPLILDVPASSFLPWM
jgi:hypothetical protein